MIEEKKQSPPYKGFDLLDAQAAGNTSVVPNNGSSLFNMGIL